MTSHPNSIETTLNLGASASHQRWKKIAWILVVVLLIAAISFFIVQKNRQNTVTYVTVPLRVQDLTTSVSATGNLEPTNTIDVGIEVSGTIDSVLVDYNDRVSVSQPMAKLDTTRLNAIVTSSKALWMKAQANEQSADAALKNALIEYDRAKSMYTSTQGNYPSKKEMQSSSTTVEQAKASLAAAKAQVAQSLAQLQSDENNLKKAIVISPINGIVLNRKIEPGQTVVASMQTPVLFTLAEDLTKMKAIVSVDEADIGGVKENQKVLFSVDAYPNKQFEGRITQLRLNSAIVNGVVTYEAVVEVKNNDLLLRPGMTASASIITETLKHVSVVPNAALRFTPPLTDDAEKKKNHATAASDKGNHIWVLRQGVPVKLKVSVGKTDGLSTVLLTPSLKSNEMIITAIKEE